MSIVAASYGTASARIVLDADHILTNGRLVHGTVVLNVTDGEARSITVQSRVKGERGKAVARVIGHGAIRDALLLNGTRRDRATVQGFTR